MRGVFAVTIHATSDDMLMIHGSNVGPGGTRDVACITGVGSIDVPCRFIMTTGACADYLSMIHIHRGLPTGAGGVACLANAGGTNVVCHFFVAA